MRPPTPPEQFGFGQLRGLRTGFIAGLLVGLLLGWVFHGVVGLFVRLGIVAMLLIPLAVVIWYFFLRRPGRSGAGEEGGGARIFTWGSDQGARRITIDPRSRAQEPPAEQAPPARSTEDIIDIEFEELKRQADDDGRPR